VLSLIRWILFLVFILSAPISAKAQQNEKTIRMDMREGILEIQRNQDDNGKLISVVLNKKLLKKFETDSGDWLDFLAMYNGSLETYIVVRTNMGQGACVGTDVFVLKISEYLRREETEPYVEVSPVLQKCMGETPEVKFANENGADIITVAGYELRDKKWVPTKPDGKRGTATKP
jgi:hypothetical protein